MKTTTHFVLCVAIGTAFAPCQRTSGGMRENLSLPSGGYTVTQAASHAPGDYTLEIWRKDDVDTSATATMPFDLPGGVARITDTQWIVGGKDSATGNGFLTRIEIATAPMGISVVDSTALGSALDPTSVVWDQAENTLFTYDSWGLKLSASPYSAWAQPPVPTEVVSLTFATHGAPTHAATNAPHEPANGILLRYHDSLPSKSLHVYQVTQQVWQVGSSNNRRSRPPMSCS